MISLLKSLLTRWFGAQQPTPVVVYPTNEPAATTAPAELHSASPQLVAYDENLYDKAKTQWQFGDWHSLANMDDNSLANHPEAGKLFLLKATAQSQLGNTTDAMSSLKQAQQCGIQKKLIAKLLVSGVYNTLGKTALIAGQQQRALGYFEQSLSNSGMAGDVKLMAKARISEQLQQLELSNPSFLSWSVEKEMVSVLMPLFRHSQKVASNNKNNQSNRLEQLNREILIAELDLSKKALLARRALAKASGVNVNGLVSIIIPTRRAHNIDVIIENITRQSYKNIELILVPHFYNESSLKELEKKAETLRSKLNNIVILKIDDTVPLGARLNRAIDAARGNYWAKMDDDDLYFENYLSDMIALFELDDYAMVGKFEQFIYLSDINKMVLRFPGWHNRLSFVSGSTFVVNRRYGGNLRFGETESGEDTALLKMAEESKLKVYAVDCFNHIVMRSADVNNHTWQVSSEYFLKEGSVVCDGLCDEFVRV
ncbi:MAG: glycosyltransferase family 2 protein [Gammaproteobacteria bacterium]|nr:glycosyltransferase family 2 protein [Gammaproteobacteria bacterium]